MSAAMRAFVAGLRAVRGEVTDLAAWWLQELRECGQFCVERIVARSSQEVVVDLSGPVGVLRAVEIAGVGGQAVEFPMRDDDELPNLDQLWERRQLRTVRARVLLPETSILVARLRMPPVKERDLDRVMALQLERVLPLPASSLYVDWKVSQRFADRSTVVAVAIARRLVIDRLRERFASWGWRIAQIAPGGDPHLRFNLLPRSRLRLTLRIGRGERYLASASVVLGGLLMLLIGGTWWYERRETGPLLEATRARIALVEAQRASIKSRAAPILALEQLMLTPSAGDALLALSERAPADAWIYQADIRSDSGGVQLSVNGYTAQTTALLEVLQAAPEFEGVELVEAHRQNPGELERVQLELQLRRVAP